MFSVHQVARTRFVISYSWETPACEVFVGGSQVQLRSYSTVEMLAGEPKKVEGISRFGQKELRYMNYCFATQSNVDYTCNSSWDWPE